MDECKKDPCPIGSSCVNTRGSFDCKCPLGFDLEDGRACARGATEVPRIHSLQMFKGDKHLTVVLQSTAKTFLGTFSLNRLPNGRVAFRSSTTIEIQREIIQLVSKVHQQIHSRTSPLFNVLFPSTASAQRFIISPPRLQPLAPQ